MQMQAAFDQRKEESGQFAGVCALLPGALFVLSVEAHKGWHGANAVSLGRASALVHVHF